MKALYVLIIAVVCFILNLVIYYISEDYRWFLSKIKWEKENNIILKDEYKINEEELIKEKEVLENVSQDVDYSSDEDKLLEKKLSHKISFSDSNDELVLDKDNFDEKVTKENSNLEKNNNIQKIEVNNISSGENQFIMSEYDNMVLNLFKSFNLVKLEYHWDLLDVTWEYPDKYFEYYTMDLTLLFFPNKTYNDLKDIFDIESNWYNFMVNEIDNFWDESFYINLWDDYKDDYIRVIFTKNERVFWFKVSKSEYSRIKNILKKL